MDSADCLGSADSSGSVGEGSCASFFLCEDSLRSLTPPCLGVRACDPQHVTAPILIVYINM